MRDRRRKTFIWFLALVAIVTILLVLTLRPTRVDKWKAMTNRIDRLQVEARSRKLPRSDLRGKLIPGNAWDEYNIALNDAQNWHDDDNGGAYLVFANGNPGVDRVRIERLVAEHAEALEHLRRGTQRTDGQYPYDWHRGYQMALPSLLGCRRLANLAAAQAKIWTESGRAQDAANVLLDVTVFARDLSTNGTLLSSLIGFAIYSTTSDGLRSLILSGKLTQNQLADLARRVEIVDRDFPTWSSALSNETMLFGTTMAKEASTPPWGRLKSGRWRTVLASKATMLNAFETKEAFLVRSGKLDQMNFADARKTGDAISAEAKASPNPIVGTSTPDLSKMLSVRRDALAHLRLVRAGTIFLATGEMPALADPFGDYLFSKQEGAKAKIWSIGKDGKNQNGSGNWEGKPDIVFEIPR